VILRDDLPPHGHILGQTRHLPILCNKVSYPTCVADEEGEPQDHFYPFVGSRSEHPIVCAPEWRFSSVSCVKGSPARGSDEWSPLIVDELVFDILYYV